MTRPQNLKESITYWITSKLSERFYNFFLPSQKIWTLHIFFHLFVDCCLARSSSSDIHLLLEIWNIQSLISLTLNNVKTIGKIVSIFLPSQKIWTLHIFFHLVDDCCLARSSSSDFHLLLETCVNKQTSLSVC